MKRTMCVIAALVLALTSVASAEVIWPGDVSPTTAGYTWYVGNDKPEPTGYTFDLPPGMTYQDTITPNTNPSWKSIIAAWQLDPAIWASELVRGDGWRIDIGAENFQVTGTKLFEYAMYLIAGDAAGGVLVSWKSPTTIAVAGVTTETITVSAAYHHVRVAMAPGGSNCDIYVDDMATPAKSVAAKSSWGLKTEWGTGSHYAGAKGNWDYIKINEVPEPGTLALLGIGLGLLGLRRFRQR